MLKRVMTAAAFAGGLLVVAAPANAMPINSDVRGQIDSPVVEIASTKTVVRTTKTTRTYNTYRKPSYTSRTVRSNGNRTVVKRTTVRPNGNVVVKKRVY